VGNKDFGQVVVWDYFGDLEFDRMAAGSRADLLPDSLQALATLTIRSSASRAER
jgi:hypothetical protein